MEIVGIEHENSILELKEKVQKLKRKADAAEDALGDKNDECKNLAVRLAVSSWGPWTCLYSYLLATKSNRFCCSNGIQAVESAWGAARGQNKLALHELKKKCVSQPRLSVSAIGLVLKLTR